MSRPRIALLGGSLLLVLACVLGCCAPAALEPQPGGADIDYPAARDAWGQTFERLAWAGIAVGFAALLLLAFGFVDWRAQRWNSKHIPPPPDG